MSEQTDARPRRWPIPAARLAVTAGHRPRVPGAAKPDPILEVDNIVRHFGGMTAVDVDHLEVQRGIITALIGPNGAGQDDVLQPDHRLRPADLGHGTGAHWSFDGRTLDKTSASQRRAARAWCAPSSSPRP